MEELTQQDRFKLSAARLSMVNECPALYQMEIEGRQIMQKENALAMAHFGIDKFRNLTPEQKEHIDRILDAEGL